MTSLPTPAMLEPKNRRQDVTETECGLRGSASCPHDLLCSTLRAYVIDRQTGGERDGYWCPRASSHRGAVARAGISLPGADGTFDPAVAAAATACLAARRAGQSPCITLGEIVGWRIWTMQRGRLLSPFQETWWPADGLVGGDPDAGFGVFAFKDRQQAITQAVQIATPRLSVAYGSVRIWGRVVEHRRGYRAEFARIASLDGACPTAGELAEVRRRYGVDASSDGVEAGCSP